MNKEIKKFISLKLEELKTFETSGSIDDYSYRLGQYNLIDDLIGFLAENNENKTQ